MPPLLVPGRVPLSAMVKRSELRKLEFRSNASEAATTRLRAGSYYRRAIEKQGPVNRVRLPQPPKGIALWRTSPSRTVE
jgi:hypothetical protein